MPFETRLVYEACSAESSEGSCAAGDVSRYECKPENTCRTCSTFSDMGGFKLGARLVPRTRPSPSTAR